MNYSTDFKSIRDDVSAQEWQTRLDLAACYRLVNQYGMADLTYNHITARIPGTEHLLINHYGLLHQPGTRRPYGVLEWPAMLRLLAATGKSLGYPPYWH